jgi:uncharacterized membrane protein
MGNPADVLLGNAHERHDRAMHRDIAPGRILAVDLARAAALGMMAVFHFVYDLELFGWVAPGTAVTGGWRMLALLTAGSFLFLAGVSLWLGHGCGVRWRGFWRRFVMVAGAAAAITVATWFALGEGFIFFGILHAIAGASLLGLLVLRVPVVGLVGLACWRSGAVLRAGGGLRSVVVLVDRLADGGGSFGRLRAAGAVVRRVPVGHGCWGGWAAVSASGRVWRPGGAAHGPSGWRCRGGYSLWIYLGHQPVLIALVWAATQVMR